MGTSLGPKPLVYLHSDVSFPENDPCDCGERAWCVDSPFTQGTRPEWGMSGLATFDDAMIGARLYVVQGQLDWRVDSDKLVETGVSVVRCWCGWSVDIRGGYADPMVAHVKDAHPDHWVVVG